MESIYNVFAGLNVYVQILLFLIGCIMVSSVLKYARRPGFDVDNKHVLITGGSEGLGLAFARVCLKLGANVTIVSRSKDKLATAVQELSADKKADRKLFSYSCDVTNFEDVQKMIAACNEEMNRTTDVVVVSAGMATPGLFLEQNMSVFHKLMDVNYFGAVHVAKACMPPMIANGVKGRISFVSSAAALTPFVGFTQYCGSKSALRGFADALRCEAGSQGIDVSVMFPSNIDTPGFVEEQKTKPEPTKTIEALGGLVSPEEVAEYLLDGLKNGHYQITNELFLELSRIQSNGLNPRNSLVTEMLWYPIVCK
ncbi:hypothetical protein SARC_07217 [Sphaeroforma arctica JP610]|uniref:3-dehydrosphinganine reductase n=1 Tax=Sphaeroforma arctica JP610 TaxID=667725 RepID=A0A0L0FUT2_9EUKA|nr:hypothetical protein SARC_07217 [Sphaeroforma arctica JP610]KNC80429.1 hypothetical protein SARC_07217 [Sphaeroforma arctica JP610]|eukprot:XP_014154331.1 hypothetical protein SARC_07217 [Sphaeroforma arctica JP610]